MVRFFGRNHVAGFCAAIVVLGAVPRSAEAQYTEKVLYSFMGGSDGARPEGALIADAKGNLYGTTFGGGINGANCADLSCGIVFMLTPKGKERVLYAFTGGSDGAGPQGALIADGQNNLYGTAYYGGGGGCEVGCGTIFKVTPQGKETVVYAFAGFSAGGLPLDGVIADTQGNFFGAAELGANTGPGEVYKVTPQGTETVLYSFQGGRDGGEPNSGLIADTQGNLYGAGIIQGGCNIGCNTVFKVTQQGTESVLYDFAHQKNGAVPVGVIADAQGNFYGTTEYGGGSGCGGKGCGTVFKLDPTGKEKVLHAFGGRHDGTFPVAGLVEDSQGNLYGTTIWGGGGGCPNGCGTVFKVTPKGRETVLYAFAGGNDGEGPEAALITDARGNLYGTTAAGGSSDNGTIFELGKN